MRQDVGQVEHGRCVHRINRAERLLAWQPQYGIADGIRHSIEWAAMRDDILPI